MKVIKICGMSRGNFIMLNAYFTTEERSKSILESSTLGN